MAINKTEKKEASDFSWRDTAIGAGSSLFVTVIGGAVLWYLTYQPQAEERITYKVVSEANFVSQGNALSFVNLKVSNEGRSKATNVIIRGSTGSGASIRDSNVQFLSGPSS